LNIKVRNTINLPSILYGCETWSFTLSYVDVRRYLSKIFETKRNEVTTGWRRIHNEELHNRNKFFTIYCSRIKSRRMRLAGHIASVDGISGVHRVLVGKPERKRPLGRPRRRWEDNLRRDLWEIGVEGDWILLAQDRVRWRALVSSVMNLRVP
ncbi:hypothetical protein L798_01121, partial [Zootermopsis nevadensis]